MYTYRIQSYETIPIITELGAQLFKVTSQTSVI